MSISNYSHDILWHGIPSWSPDDPLKSYYLSSTSQKCYMTIIQNEYLFIRQSCEDILTFHTKSEFNGHRSKIFPSTIFWRIIALLLQFRSVICQSFIINILLYTMIVWRYYPTSKSQEPDMTIMFFQRTSKNTLWQFLLLFCKLLKLFFCLI